jgi:DNA polymerase III subunit delta'
MYNFRQPELSYMTQDEEDFAKNFARFINEANIIDISDLFEESKKFIAQNANPKIVFFDMALKVIVLLIRK